MIDKILPCPDCGDYPDFNLYEPSVNKYTISINCCCKETCEVIHRLEEEQNDLISIISEWNAFAEDNQTIKVLKSDLQEWRLMLSVLLRRGNRSEDIVNAFNKLKEYLGEAEDD